MEYPPFYAFPPFFTYVRISLCKKYANPITSRQTHEVTWLKQLDTWKTIILRHCRAERLFIINPSNDEILQKRPFRNEEIQRSISKDFLKEILMEMTSKGLAIIINSSSSIDDCISFIILWNTIEEWSSKVERHVLRNGLRATLITIFELLEEDSQKDEEDRFDDVPLSLFSIIIDHLQSDGKVALLNGTDSSLIGPETGVKFL